MFYVSKVADSKDRTPDYAPVSVRRAIMASLAFPPIRGTIVFGVSNLWSGRKPTFLLLCGRKYHRRFPAAPFLGLRQQRMESDEMELHVTGELEAKLTQVAAKQGRDPDDLVQDLLARYFDEEMLFGVGLYGRSGAALVEAMQASPYKDIDLQPTRACLPVRNAAL
jgi:hypothetical protein